MSVTFCRTAGAPAGARSCASAPGSTTPRVAAALEAGLLPVETARADAPGDRLGGRPPTAHASSSPAGSPAGASPCATPAPRADVLDALVRTGAAFLRTDAASGLEEAVGLWLAARASRPRVSVAVADARRGPRRDRRRRGRPGRRRLGRRRGRRTARRHRPARARRAHRPSPRDRDRRRPRGARAAALHGLARPDRRLGRRAPALRLGARARRACRRCRARRLSAEWERRRPGATRRAEEGLGRLAPDLRRDPRALARRHAAARDRGRAALPRPRRRGRGDRKGRRQIRARGAAATTVTYVVNRNINYTNQCYFRCGFCGFSRGPKSLNLRGDPYILNVARGGRTARSRPGSAAPPRSACRAASTPTSPATSTSSVLEGIKERLPEMHVHGFTPLEVWQGAQTLGISRARVPHPPARRRPRAPCRARPPRSSTTASACTCARTRCARPSGPR